MRSFGSDNHSGVHPLIMEALINANKDHALGYGEDQWTEEAVEKIREAFTPDCEPLFVFNGTGCNATGLQLLTRPYQTIYCAATAHIQCDECGAPTKETGCSLTLIPTDDGKLTPELIENVMTGVGEQHHAQPGAIYLTNATELGTIYTPTEIKKITDFAHKHNMYVHMDGARICNAAAALGVSLRELTVDCGVDTLAFGGTKNGLLIGECLIVFNKLFTKQAKYVRKQSAQLASKMRFISCQFTAMFTNDLWKVCATQANEKAQMLYSKLKQFPDVHFTQEHDSNQLFLTIPIPIAKKMQEKFHFFFWNEAKGEIRLVTSFDTTDEDIDCFISELSRLLTSTK